MARTLNGKITTPRLLYLEIGSNTGFRDRSLLAMTGDPG